MIRSARVSARLASHRITSKLLGEEHLVVRTTIWLRKLEDFAAMNRAYRVRFSQEPPAPITVAVSELLFGAAIEIDAIASMPAAHGPGEHK